MVNKNTDKRKFQRQEINTDIRYAVLVPSFKKGIAKDISAGGLCVLIDEQLKRGDILRVEFYLPGEKDSIEAVAKVAWQRDQSGKFLTGIEFLS